MSGPTKTKHRRKLQLRAMLAVLVLGLVGCDESCQRGVCIIIGLGHWVCDRYPPEDCSPCYCVSQAFKAASTARPGRSLIIGAAAHLPGALGTNWRSDAEVHATGDQNASFTIAVLDHGADNSQPLTRDFTLEAGRSVRLGDLLDTQFGQSGKAALRITPTGGEVMVTSRTYNLLGDGNSLGLPAGATFGQYIPAENVSSAIGASREGRLIHLSHQPDSAGGFRTNLGLVSASATPMSVAVDLYSGDGADLGTVTVDMAPYEYRQIGKVFERVTAMPVDDGYAIVRPTGEGDAVYAQASVVDNLTGDPVLIPATLEPVRTGQSTYIIASAHLRGAADTNWRTDVAVHAWGSRAATYRIELLPHGQGNASPQQQTFSLAAGESRRHDDVLDAVFDFSGKAALRVTALSGELVVTSRTYNLLGDGNSLGLPAGASFGQFIPATTSEQAIHLGEHGRLIQLSHDPSGASGFRTNIALLNATAETITAEVELYAADGSQLGTVSRELAAYEYRQLDRVFEMVTAETVSDGYAVVRTTSEGGALYALASVVDNLTGDPVGMMAKALRSAGAERVLDTTNGLLKLLGPSLTGEAVNLEEVVSQVQAAGVDGVLDALEDLDPTVATRTGSVLSFEYGEQYTSDSGMTMGGQMVLDLSGLEVTGDGISGAASMSSSSYLENGQEPLVKQMTWGFDLAVEGDGRVVGDMTLSGEDGSKSGSTVSGTLGFDTDVCPTYPISGSVDVEVDGETITIRFSPSCDGEVEHDVSDDGAGPGIGVLWDLSHGVYYRYDPFPETAHDEMEAEMANLGFALSTTSAGFAEAALDGYDVLVVSAMTTWDSVYSTSEVEAIASFVASGGGLLVQGEWPNVATQNDHVQPVSGRFGITVGGNEIRPNPISVPVDSAHRIFDAVSAIEFRGAGELQVEPPAEAVLSAGGQPIIATALVGEGRVVVIGDTMWLNTTIDNDDNRTFLGSLLRWLAQSDS